jgi:dTDP-glucose 4,6-dehydratase
MTRTVLVTGAGGFIGSHLCDALVRRGDDVRALVRYNGRGDPGHLGKLEPEIRDEIEIVQGDVTDPYAMDAVVRGREIVLHLAALIAIPYSYVAPHSVFTTNTLGTVHLLQAARQQQVQRFVHVSTSEVYGTARTIPITEEHPLTGQSPYSASKIGADQAAESFHRAFDLPLVTVRPFNTYGPRQSARAIIPTIVTQALSSVRVRLGSLAPTRDLTFVTDTAAGMIAASDAPNVLGETFNLGNGKHVSIGDLANLIFDLLEQEQPRPTIETDPARRRPLNSEVERLCADASKARRMLGWEPRVTLSEGLKATIAAIRADLASYPQVGTFQH